MITDLKISGSNNDSKSRGLRIRFIQIWRGVYDNNSITNTCTISKVDYKTTKYNTLQTLTIVKKNKNYSRQLIFFPFKNELT